MEKEKKKGAWILKLIGFLFIIYLSLTIAIDSGYYQSKLSERTMITKEAMDQFEEDVKNGKEVDITDYITEIHKDYSNGTTKAGVAFSKVIEDINSNGRCIKKIIHIKVL